MSSVDVGGKVAVVTGASGGIGEAAARALAKAGMKVALFARSGDKITALAEEIGNGAIAIPGDVAKPEDVKQLFAAVESSFGGVDLLFNNAGIGILGKFADQDPADWKAQIDINVYGVLYVTQAAIPLMRGRPGAMISTVSSVAGQYGLENWSVYSATKYAVNGLHDAWRKELAADGIRVSLILPGPVWTNWGDKVPEGAMQKRRETLQALTPDDVAQALLHSFATPPNVLFEEITIRPLLQVSP